MQGDITFNLSRHPFLLHYINHNNTKSPKTIFFISVVRSRLILYSYITQLHVVYLIYVLKIQYFTLNLEVYVNRN